MVANDNLLFVHLLAQGTGMGNTVTLRIPTLSTDWQGGLTAMTPTDAHKLAQTSRDNNAAADSEMVTRSQRC